MMLRAGPAFIIACISDDAYPEQVSEVIVRKLSLLE